MNNMIKTVTAEKIHFAIVDKISNGSSYIDALVEYAEENGLEIESLATIIKKSDVLREKIRSEAVLLNMVKRDKEDVRLCE